MMKRNNHHHILSKAMVLLTLICCATTNCFSQDTITISYIGNMGVLIGNDKQAVLIDGFHKEYGPQYLFPSDSLVNNIIAGGYDGFGTVDIAVATHRHGDHFDPTYFRSFLDANKSSFAILSPQAKEILKVEIKKQKVALHEQIKTADYNGKAHTFQHDHVEVKAFQCDHVNPSRHKSIENMAYVVNLKGISVLHVGDTNWDVAEKHLVAQQELLKYLDVAILPYWMLLDKNSIELFERLINSSSIIATHIPPDFDENQKKSILENFAKVTLFTEIGQAIEIFDVHIR